jgi:hypothetical protein
MTAILGMLVTPVYAAESAKQDQSKIEAAGEKVGTAVEKAATATGSAVKNAAAKTGKALKKAASKTGKAVEIGATKTGEALEKTGKKIQSWAGGKRDEAARRVE